MAGRGDIKAGAAYVEMYVNNSKLVKGLQAAQQRLASFGGSVQRIGQGFALAGTAIAAPMAGALGWGVSLAAEAEQASVAFGVLLGSEEKAAKMLAEIKTFAASTPFDEAGLKSSAQLLLNFGVAGDDVMTTLKMLGDVAGGDANKLQGLSLAFGQMSSTGRLMGQDLNQMINAGFNPLLEISRTTGRSMADLKGDMEAGNISVAMVTNAFQTVTSEGGRFFGMMDKQSKTMTGIWSTLKDSVASIMLDLGNAVLPILKQVATFTTEFLATVKKLNASSGGAFTKIVLAVAAVGAGLVAVGGIIYAVGTAFTAVAAVIGGLVTAISAIGTVIGLVFSPLGAVVLVVGAVAAGLAAGIYAFARYTEAGRAMVDFLREKFTQIMTFAKEVFGGVVNALQGGDLKLAGQIGMAGLTVAWLKGLAALKTGFADFATYILDRFGSSIIGLVKVLESGAKQMLDTLRKIDVTGLLKDVTLPALSANVATTMKHLKIGAGASAEGANKDVVEAEQNLARLIEEARSLVAKPAGENLGTGGGYAPGDAPPIAKPDLAALGKQATVFASSYAAGSATSVAGDNPAKKTVEELKAFRQDEKDRHKAMLKAVEKINARVLVFE